MNSIAIERDGGALTHLFDFSTCETMWPHIPEDQVVFCTICGQLVTLSLESVSQSARIRLNALRILHKLWCVDFEELCCKGTNLMIVRASLQSREHSHVNPLFDVWDLLSVLVEDHARAWSSQRLVSGCGDHVAILERRRML